MYKKAAVALFGTVLVLTAVVLLLSAAGSLHWRAMHDSPPMIYAAYLMSGGSVPYRDFFDMNMPGTYFVMLTMGKIFGWNDFGFRIFDLFCLALITGFTFLWMRRAGKFAALAASLAGPLAYLSSGPLMSMQREYIALVPLTAMLATVTARPGFHPVVRALLAGLFAGLAVSIKPHFLLFFIPAAVFFLRETAPSVSVKRTIPALFGGLFLPLFATTVYLAESGGLRPFIDIALNYWPLYTQLTGYREIVTGMDRIIDTASSTTIALLSPYTLIGLVGTVIAYRDASQRRMLWMTAGLIAVGVICPVIAGQFWHYHWMPYFYFCLCAAAMGLNRFPDGQPTWMTGVALVTMLCLLTVLSVKSISILRTPEDLPVPEHGVADEISGYLGSHLRPGDTVQPFDWIGGAVHGMLIARAPLATRFMYDFHFFHHISNPYIQNLRREFIRELDAAPPAYFVIVFKDRARPNGPDTTREFPELVDFLGREGYGPAQEGEAYVILKRRDIP